LSRPADELPAAEPFSPGNGIDLFAAARSRLASLGPRVPGVYLLDRDRVGHHADIAILEDFPGEDLLAFRERDPVAAEPTLARLRAGLAVMRAYRPVAFQSSFRKTYGYLRKFTTSLRVKVAAD
jgi:hypothetical protein